MADCGPVKLESQEGNGVLFAGTPVHAKGPGRRGLLCFLSGCVRNQAAIVRAFFFAISSSARSQSSSS
jgi:hypothetical protein